MTNAIIQITGRLNDAEFLQSLGFQTAAFKARPEIVTAEAFFRNAEDCEAVLARLVSHNADFCGYVYHDALSLIVHTREGDWVRSPELIRQGEINVSADRDAAYAAFVSLCQVVERRLG